MRRSRRPPAAIRALAWAWLAAALLCGCAASGRQCTGTLQPINATAAVAAAPEERDEQ